MCKCKIVNSCFIYFYLRHMYTCEYKCCIDFFCIDDAHARNKLMSFIILEKLKQWNTSFLFMYVSSMFGANFKVKWAVFLKFLLSIDTIYIDTFLDRHRPCRSHNSLIAYDPEEESLSSFFASFFQDLVLARVSSR